MSPPRCPHFGPCGGCQLQHLPYDAQLARKREALEGMLRRTLGAGAPAVAPVIGMPRQGDAPWAFRHKASFVFGPGLPPRGGLVMGHYEARSKRIVPVRECPVHSSRANRIAFALRDRLAAAGIPAAGPRLDGLLRHVLVRTSRDEREAVATLVVTRNDKSLRRPVRALLASSDRPDGFYVSIHDRPGPFIIGDETVHVDGRTHVRESCAGASFLISPTAFFQTNPAAAEVLVHLVLESIAAVAPDGGEVLDLYAGSGLFAIPLAMAGHRVTAIEEHPRAVADGEANRRLNRVPEARLRFVRARVEDRAGGSALAASAGQPPIVVLDPPRQGCPAAVIEAVFRRLAPARAVYVSCNPESLAEELPAIVAAGYSVTRVQPVDMFPHTDHIETVVTLDQDRARRARGERRRR